MNPLLDLHTRRPRRPSLRALALEAVLSTMIASAVALAVLTAL